MISPFALPLLLAANMSQYPTIDGSPIFCYMEDSSGVIIPLDICGRSRPREEPLTEISSTVVDVLNFSAEEDRDNKTYYNEKFCEFKIGEPYNEPILNYGDLAATWTISHMQRTYRGRVSKEDLSVLDNGIREYVAKLPEPDCD